MNKIGKFFLVVFTMAGAVLTMEHTMYFLTNPPGIEQWRSLCDVAGSASLLVMASLALTYLRKQDFSNHK
jgi:hypothetical protein